MFRFKNLTEVVNAYKIAHLRLSYLPNLIGKGSLSLKDMRVERSDPTRIHRHRLESSKDMSARISSPLRNERGVNNF
jgi:hypothetical protein